MLISDLFHRLDHAGFHSRRLPFTGLPPLAAKHGWLLPNMVMVAAGIWLRALDQPRSRDTGLTPARFDVLEMSFYRMARLSSPLTPFMPSDS
jgi:hypothetical protein